MRDQLLKDLTIISEKVDVDSKIIRTGMNFMQTTDLSSVDENGTEDLFQIYHIPINPKGQYSSTGLHVAYHFNKLLDVAITNTSILENNLIMSSDFKLSGNRLWLTSDFTTNRWKIEVEIKEDNTINKSNSKLKKFWKCVNERCGSGVIGTACAVAAGACIADPTKLSCAAVALVCGTCGVSCVFYALK